MSEFDEVKTLAILLTNLGKKKRSENLLKIAEYCVRLKERYNSWIELAKIIKISDDRAHISAEMLREFGTIVALPDDIKEMIRENLITSVDAAYRISRLENENDQKILAQATVDKNLSASDVRAIVEYKTKNPNVNMDQAIKRVLESKGKVVTHHIVIMELTEKTVETLKEEAEKLKQPVDKFVFEMLKKVWNKDWLLSFGMRDSDIILKVSDEGFKALQQEAKKFYVELKDLAEKIVQKELRENG